MDRAARSQLMERIRSRDTKPEVAFRRAIWHRGFRFRICDTRLDGKPDLIFPAHRLAVYIDGDFWHGHQWRTRKLASLDDQFSGSATADYWKAKIRRNINRDFLVTQANLEAGWSVLRFWESDITHHLEACVDMTAAVIKDGNRTGPAAIVPRRTAAEFFAGIGLVRLALERQGWSVVFANDNDLQKAQMYRANFGGDHLTTADIRKLKAGDIPDCTLYTASFPCNNLSIAGGMSGLDGEHSSMFWEFTRILREKGDARPPLILLENVVGFLMSHEGRDFEAAMLELNELGYCVDVMIANASHFTPQSRARMFIVGKQVPQKAEVVVETSNARPIPLIKYIAAHHNIAWDIIPLPDLPEPSSRLEDIVENLPASDPLWWDEKRTEYFMNQLSERHLATAREMIAGTKYTYATAFRRVRNGRSMAELRTDGIAGCLRTPRGGSGRQILFKAGRGKHAVRLLSGRECARLQGVPDDYKIEVPLNQALFGFGDAVCVPVVEWIIDNYLTPTASELLRNRVLRKGPHRT
jgi:DNA (cytosine-5)-methyltransferase 1